MTDPATGARGETRAQELTRPQAALVRRVAESRATVPDLTLEADVDAGDLLGGEEPLLDLVIHAAGQALRAHPQANGSYRDGGWEQHGRVNVGVAVERDATFVVPTIFDADTLAVEAVAAARADLAGRAADGSLTSPELAGGTFTVWDAGPGGAARLTPVLVPGQAGALGVGAPRPAAVVRAGRVEAGHLLTLTLVCDHRILFGHTAAAFLADLVRGLSVA
jgi:pyruvate dehydrogenase E2 component (dihydrolipoamide acetyltransferase)